MAKKYDAILLYSDDIWNNNREGDFSDAEVIMKGKASETNCETYFPCGLYYELGSTDDLGYQCLDISSDDKKYGFEVVTVVLSSPDGRKIPLEYPTNSRQYPVTFGGKDGQAVSFFVDGVETYRSSKNAKAKAKKFIEERIEKLRSCAAPFAAESMEMGMEEMASEFSVERINPTPVSGKADMKAESFGAEENLAVADVDIHDGMNIPAGSGAIIGQAIPETDFTPFGASAEDAPVPADPRVSPLSEGLHTPSNTPTMAAEGNSYTNYQPLPEWPPAARHIITGLSKWERDESDKYRCSPVYLIDGEWSWCNGGSGDLGHIDGGGGSGPLCSYCGMNMETGSFSAESFGAENPPVPADPRVSPLNTGLHTPSDSPEMAAEGVSKTKVQIEIGDSSGQTKGYRNRIFSVSPIDEGDGSIDYLIDDLETLIEERVAGWNATYDYMLNDLNAENPPVPADPRVSPLNKGLHTPSDTPDLSAEENLAIQDVEIWDGMVLPEGTGNVMGQMTPTTDFTPFGVSAEQAADPMPNESAIVGQTSDGTPYTRFGYEAESYMEETFKPDGMGEVVGAITAETDYTPFGASAEDMEAEAFGGDLASLNDFNGVESVRVEAPLGHGVTENLGAEELDTYGGLMGVAAAFIGGMAFSHWSKGKTSGDNAPDSETPSEESDDAPQA